MFGLFFFCPGGFPLNLGTPNCGTRQIGSSEQGGYDDHREICIALKKLLPSSKNICRFRFLRNNFDKIYIKKY
jgi:hypothetical protein